MRELIFSPMPSDAKYKNYCSWDYQPNCNGTGKLRPSALLYFAISDLGHRQFLCEAIAHIQATHGLFESVYGIKRVANGWKLEIYVYDYERTDRKHSWSNLFGKPSQVLKSPLQIRESTPYFMFSFDLDESVAANQGVVDTAHLYIGNAGSMVSSGIAYRQNSAGLTLENFYFFFDAANQQREIIDKMTESVFWDTHTNRVDETLAPELKACDTICLANKPHCDTVYFSGINVEQLIHFCEWQRYPHKFLDFLLANRFQLDHLKYDVGIDYRWRKDRLECLKSGIYGCF